MTFLTPEYRGYVGSIEHSKEDGVFFGSIQFITDMVSYESEDLNDLETVFHNAVDEYIADCSSLNKLPDKPTQQNKFVDWHPYPKEKPKKDGVYLVTMRVWDATYEDYFVGVGVSYFMNADFKEDAIHEVIAWAKQPEPYQPEVKNE